MRKGQFKKTDYNEIRECTECKERKSILEFVKGKRDLYRYQCKECKNKKRRTGNPNQGCFKKGQKSKGKVFQKGHIPWYKIKNVPHPTKGTGIKETRDSSKCKEWKNSVKKRDNYMCVKCGSNKNIAAHHINSWKDHENLRFCLDNGQTLCCSCHALEEGLGTKIRPEYIK
jgi:hypothetical protein